MRLYENHFSSSRWRGCRFESYLRSQTISLRTPTPRLLTPSALASGDRTPQWRRQRRILHFDITSGALSRRGEGRAHKRLWLPGTALVFATSYLIAARKI